MRSPARILWLVVACAGLAAPAAAQPLDVQFLHCVPTSPGALEYTCSLAGPCSESPCLPTEWTPIEGIQSLPPSFFTPGGTRASAIQITREPVAGVTYTLVNKDVGGQRWAIIQNPDTGIVTGNVFTGAAEGGVQFIYCPEYAPGAGVVTLSGCEIALPCASEGCDPADWSPVGGSSEVAASFFNPGGGRASGLQVTPEGEEILISKDLGPQRWAITALADEQTEDFPLGIGPVFGNIFEVEDEEPATLESVLRANANIAFAAYEDSLDTARALLTAVQALVATPSEGTLTAARQAWIAAREPYGQTEVYRFQAGPIDALRDDGTIGEDGDGPEGRINAWPLGEALIDYVAPEVDGDAGPESPDSVSTVNGNVIADAASFPSLTPEVLAGLNEIGGDERNVATGYHAIEFLLWGQDLNADGGSGLGGRDNTPGHRSFTDYLPDGQGCTNGSCGRRGQYLVSVTQLLVSDLERVAATWNPQGGAYYAEFTAGGKVSLAKILEGVGRLAFGEVAGERMNIALVTNSQEDEHSCFSDNTHRDLLLDQMGIRNAWTGRYVRVDGTVLDGPGPDALLRAQGDAAIADEMTAKVDDAVAKLEVINDLAEEGQPFDNLIQQGINQQDVRGAIEALIAQIPPLEQVIVALEVTTGDLCQDTEQFECAI